MIPLAFHFVKRTKNEQRKMGRCLWGYRSGEEAAKRVVSAPELKPQRSPRNGGVAWPGMMLELRANAEKCGGVMPIEARTKREKVVADDPQRTESEQREIHLSPLAMLQPGEEVKAPPF